MRRLSTTKCTYLPTYLPTYLSTYLPTYLPTFWSRSTTLVCAETLSGSLNFPRYFISAQLHLS